MNKKVARAIEIKIRGIRLMNDLTNEECEAVWGVTKAEMIERKLNDLDCFVADFGCFYAVPGDVCMCKHGCKWYPNWTPGK